MRDYLYQKLMGQKDRFAESIKRGVDDRLTGTAHHLLNTKRGQVTGEGTVRGSFILGSVQIGKNSVLANSIVDQKVTLIIEDGVKITDCGFHPYILHERSQLVQTVIRIRKNSVIAKAYISIPTDIGEGCVMDWVGFNLNRQDYNTEGPPEGITIGENCVMHYAFLNAVKGSDPKKAETVCKCTIGKNTFIHRAKISAINGSISIGEDSVVFEASDITECIRGQITPAISPFDSQPMDRLRNVNDMDGLWAADANITIGNKACVLMDLLIQGAFEKIKDGYFSFGDGALFLHSCANHHSTSTPCLYAHTFKTGKNTTLCATGDGWYASNYPLRRVEIGDNSLLRMQSHRDGHLIGSDLKAPNDSIVVI